MGDGRSLRNGSISRTRRNTWVLLRGLTIRYTVSGMCRVCIIWVPACTLNGNLGRSLDRAICSWRYMVSFCRWRCSKTLRLKHWANWQACRRGSQWCCASYTWLEQRNGAWMLGRRSGQLDSRRGFTFRKEEWSVMIEKSSFKVFVSIIQCDYIFTMMKNKKHRTLWYYPSSFFKLESSSSKVSFSLFFNRTPTYFQFSVQKLSVYPVPLISLTENNKVKT